jgi:hypothetical protein
MTATDYDRIYREQEARRVARAHEGRKELVPYNKNYEEGQIERGKATSLDLLPIPELGCLVGRNDSGYGDCSTDTWIVTARFYTKATRQIKTLTVTRVYGLDVGTGDADAMPEHPGLAAIDPAQTRELTVHWEGGYVRWGEYDKKARWWRNASWTVGQYRPSSGGIDK